ncbi:NAD(P)/FAD-dependent oxidoreductase [Dongia rigui]|uniref:FAD-binding oxidoreductase n=1 Tax=Dongia rigui TaxID=940149 RepID=A0ABU5DWN3_9PROT|nr:FAD-binding oxidoreductase [Dongia rigui]MDY0871354.1 FAD-binding oxidoreductase [Dongia rigui]
MTDAAVADRSGWVALAGTYKNFPALAGASKADWLVIGGGFTGLAAARRLAELHPNHRIVLIDRKRLGQGASGRNSGFAVSREMPGPSELEKPAGRAAYLAQAAIHQAAGAEVKRLIDELRIDCDYDPNGYIFAVHERDKFKALEERVNAINDLGGEAKLLDAAALRSRLGIAFYNHGLWIGGGNALLQPARFAKGLIDALPATVECYENTEAVKITHEPGGGATVSLRDGHIRAARVIIGLNAFMPRLGVKRGRVFPISLTASLTRPLTPAEEEAIGHAGPWGGLCPIEGGATVRLTNDRRILMRNTAEYEPDGISQAMLAKRRAWHEMGLRHRFPFLAKDAIEFTWSGHMCASRNWSFVFEELSHGVFAAGCYNGAGLARGTLLGRLIAEHASGETSPLIENALAREKPSWVPTGPLFTLIAKIRLAHELQAAKSEH